MSLEEASKLLKEAETLFRHRNLDEAKTYYREAGLIYRAESHPKEAAHCFAQSAQCEKLRTGLEPLLEAAGLSEMAAREALKARDFAFARWQYREAGLLYEREGDFEKYSNCYRESQNAFVRYLWYVFTSGKIQQRAKEERPASWYERMESFARAFFGMISRYLWGYGENPFNAFIFAIILIFTCAIIYFFSGQLAYQGVPVAPSFLDAVYLSGVTFSTLGYGDFTPLGWVRIIAFIESLSGFILVPLSIIALTRRYLRVYR